MIVRNRTRHAAHATPATSAPAVVLPDTSAPAPVRPAVVLPASYYLRHGATSAPATEPAPAVVLPAAFYIRHGAGATLPAPSAPAPSAPAPSATATREATHARLAADVAHGAAELAARDATRRQSAPAPSTTERPGQRSGASANYAALAALPAPTTDKTGKPRGVNTRAYANVYTYINALAAFGRAASDAPTSLFYQYDDAGRSIPEYVAGCYARSVRRLAAGQYAEFNGYTPGEARYVAQYGRADVLARGIAGHGPAVESAPAPVRQNASQSAPEPRSATPADVADRNAVHPLHAAMVAAGLTRHSYARYAWPDGKIITLATERAPGNVARSEATARRIGRRARSA